MLAAIGIILLIGWLLGLVVFKVAGGLIHILLVVGVIALIWNLIAGRRTTPTV